MRIFCRVKGEFSSLFFFENFHFVIKILIVYYDKRGKRNLLFLSGVKERKMTIREAIRILMLSPFYFRLTPKNRKQLIEEFCELCRQTEKSIKA